MSLGSFPPEPIPSDFRSPVGLVTVTPEPGTDTAAAIAAGMLPAGKPRSTLRRGLEVFLENRLAVTSAGVFIFMLLFCFVGPHIYQTNQLQVNFALEEQAPSAAHLLGTDQNGFDVLGRLMIAGQVSLEVGIAAAALATVVGVLWGAIAGYVGGFVDSFMMRIVDAMLSIPTLFLALVVVSMVTPDKPVLILVIALTSWLTTSRLVRGEALSLRTRDYVQAMKMMGGGGTRAVLRHIAPNAVGTIMVNATFQVADAIALIVTLSYLGLGIRPPQTEWGTMLSDGTQYLNDGYWWLIVPAGFCIVIVIAAAIFIGEGLRDAVEVRLQRR
jgi:peptide/nickel transport system permease protein